MGLGIDIGVRTLKAVRLQRGVRGVRVTGAATVPMRGDALLPALEEALRGAGRGLLAAVGVSGREVSLQYRGMPPVAPYMLKTMVQFDLQDLLQRSGGDSYADWTVLAPAPGPQGETIVLVGLAKRAFVDEKVTTIEAAGVRLLDLCPAPLGLFAAHANFGDPVRGERTLLLDIGAELTQIAVAEGDRLLFARTVSAGGKLFTEQVQKALGVPAEEAERLKAAAGGLDGGSGRTADVRTALRSAAGQPASILQSSVTFARAQLKRDELEIARVVLSGGASRLGGFTDYLQGALEKPVTVFRPFARLDLRGLPADAMETLKASGEDLTVALGLAAMALRPARTTTISLLPDARKKRREFHRRGIHVAAAAVVLGTTLALLWGAGLRRRAAEEAVTAEFSVKQKEITDRFERFERVLLDQKALLAKQAALEREAVVARTAIDAIARLRKALPDRLWISRIALTAGEAGAVPSRRDAPPPPPKIVIVGRADDAALREPQKELEAIGRQLRQMDRRISVQTGVRSLPEKPGVLEFQIEITFEAPEAAPPAGG